MAFLKECAAVLIGLCGGLTVSAGVFAFIAVVGIAPRIAYKSNTSRYIKVYEEAIIFGGIFGGTTYIFDYFIPLGTLALIMTGVLYGIFVGCIAVCLAEILNVLPILARKAGVQRGIGLFITAFALGKLLGTLLYFYIPDFTKG